MDLHIASRGFVLGLAVAAPIGPIGTLVIRRSFNDGMRAGLCTGMGAAVADAIYAAVAALGVATFAHTLVSTRPFHLGAAALLVWLGVRTLIARPATTAEGPAPASTYGRAFAVAVALTLANPTTIASFAAASTAVGVGVDASPRSAALFASAVFAGSASWWIFLSAVTSALRARLGAPAREAIRIVAATSLFAFAWMALTR